MRRTAPLLALCLAMACGQPRKEAPSPQPAPPLRIVATGDILMHEDVKRSAAVHSLDSLFADISPLFKGADLGFANLETALAPKTGAPGAPYVFNAPAELATTLRSAGFTVLSTANNHAFDQGSRALVETLEHLEAADLRSVGSGRTKGAAEAPLLLDLRGTRVAVLAFTDLFNSNLNRKPEGPWVAAYDAIRGPERVKAVRGVADIVVVSLHWGDEYALQPTPRQKEIAQALVAAGADLIFGHHPHVLQPLVRVRAGGREGIVAYSMGNCISNQDRMYRPDRQPAPAGDNRDGVAIQVTVPHEGPLKVTAEPLWTDNNWRERQEGKASAPTIRVVPTRTALLAARSEVTRLEAPSASDAKALEAARSRVRLLERRLERVREVLGTLELAP